MVDLYHLIVQLEERFMKQKMTESNVKNEKFRYSDTFSHDIELYFKIIIIDMKKTYI